MKNFKLILKSLFSNNATVEGARHRPWYFAVLMVFFSLILAVLPIFVQNISKSGSDVVKKNTYNMDNLSLRFSEELKEKDVTLVVSIDETDKSHVLLDNGSWSKISTNSYTYDGVAYTYYSHETEGVEDLRAFYLPSFSSSTLSEFVKQLEHEATDEKPLPSLILMTSKTFVVYVCNPATKAAIGSVVGDYESTPIDWSFDKLLAEKDESSPEAYNAYVNKTWENWKAFYNEAYNKNRLTATWTTTLIMLAIDLAIVFFMGLMVFILTRGKNNPFRIYTFWESIKVGFWAANMPAILTCGLGFLLTNFVQVLFALLVGVRVMWLTMKTLGPNNAPTPAGSYKQVKTVDAKPIKK